ncbi:IDEAL domain-containing protein [Virgibacillus kimchii]
MLAFKTIKPYHLETDSDYVYLVLAKSDFTILINYKEYNFIPMKARKIKVNRVTGQIVNPHDIYAFQRGQNIIYITLTRFIQMTDFLVELHRFVKPYCYPQDKFDMIYDNDMVIDELERLNVKRLIDRALDQGDRDSFYKLLKKL